jgi:hypothetical protein
MSNNFDKNIKTLTFKNKQCLNVYIAIIIFQTEMRTPNM